MTAVPESHPRYVSLKLRDAIVAGVENGITSIHGLIAHGRGEAFDYLIGEKTRPFALEAIHAAAAMLLVAKSPVISVNGNAAALVPDELVALAKLLGAPLEVNIFHTSSEREHAIRDHLVVRGAENVLEPTTDAEIPGLESNRRFVHPLGIFKADVVFVPLEDGDRCEALRGMGKDVITVDLNPMSRTAKTASVTIVDNVVRAMPLLIDEVRAVGSSGAATATQWLRGYSNNAQLAAAEQRIRTPQTS
jgi:4-phosphopantoate--beta-alanine ligase